MLPCPFILPVRLFFSGSEKLSAWEQKSLTGDLKAFIWRSREKPQEDVSSRGFQLVDFVDKL